MKFIMPLFANPGYVFPQLKKSYIQSIRKLHTHVAYFHNSSTIFLLLIFLLTGNKSTLAQFASGGTGHYRNYIYWMPWNAGKLGEFNKSSGTITWTKDDGLPEGVEITMNITAISGDGKLYSSGTGANDTFDELYGSFTNNAIATLDNALLTRSVNLTMTVNGSPVLPHLVFADAENSTTGEYIKVSRPGNEGWFFMEGWDRTTGNSSDYSFSISGVNNQIATTQPLGSEIVSPVGTYVLMAPNISAFDLELKGAVTTAVALGIYLPTDYADALGYIHSSHLIEQFATNSFLPSGTYGNGSANDGQIYPGQNPGNYWPITDIIEKIHLGFTVDADQTYAANAQATGDDLSGYDDEDAVSSLPELIINSIDDYSVTCYSYNNSGKNTNLYAWIDFDRDGKFDDNEMVNNGNPITIPSSNTLNINTLTWKITDYSCDAGTIKAGRSYMRIRLTTNNLVDSNSEYDGRSTGVTKDGEVEDHIINIMGFDYGDLPISYGTASAIVNPDTDDNGMPDAAGSIWLGNIVDYTECSALFSNDAKGDDSNGKSDEDGLTIPSDLIPGSTSSWTVKLNSQASVANANWGMWVDWNNNGVFGDVDDGFFNGAIDVSSLTQITVPVAVPDINLTKFAVRLMVRTSSQGAFTVNEYNTESIKNGEVEDYLIDVPLKAFIVTQKNIPCFGGNNGEVTVKAIGGTPPYLFSIDGVNYTTNVYYNNLAPGNYTIYVKDNAGASVTVPVNITQPATIQVVVTTQTNIACFGEANGSASVTASGGTAPYRYYFNGESAPRATGDFTGLAVGTYPVKVLDANDCEANQTITITGPTAALNALVATQVNIDCNSNNSGSFTITATGGTAPYQYSNDGGATFQSGATFSNLTAKIYVVKVKDAKNCTFDLNVTITQPEELKATASVITPASCFGSSTGAATVTATGGTVPYRYSIDNGANYNATGLFSGLPAGNYNVLVKDLNNCQTTVSLVIAQPAASLQASVTSQKNINCFGDTDGSADVTATGGVTPYRFYFNGESAPRVSGSFTGLTAGSYPVKVLDANDCEANLTITITGPTEALNASLTSKVNSDCYNNNNGSFILSATGGTAPYQYSNDGGATFQSGATFSNLTAKSYSVIVKDAKNCTFFMEVIITQPAELKASATDQTQVSCFGSSTGSATVTATGGTPPYRYSIDNGANYNATGLFTGLSAGNYTVLVKDLNNCQTTISLSIAQPASSLQVSVTAQTNINCFGETNGSASVTASGGTAPYRYYFNGESAPRATGDFTRLAVGTYPVKVLDANDCEANQTITITGPTEALNALVATQVNIDCNNNNSGSFTITATGGTAPYQYSNDGGATFQSGATFSNLTAKIYAVKVKDAKNCTFDLNVTITQPEELKATASVITPASCFGSNTGAATVTATGGTVPYRYSIDNGANYNATGLFSGLIAGNYTVLVKDLNNCQTTISVSIAQPDALQSSVTSQTNVDCVNLTGSFTITANGGTAPYTYSLNGGAEQPTGTFSNLIVGNYVITIKDLNGCTITPNVAILNQSDIQPSLSADYQTICKNNQVNFTASGGDEYEFSINSIIVRPKSAVATYTTTTLSDGDVVSVQVFKNSNGCKAFAAPITITVNPMPVVTISSFSDICTNAAPFALTGGLPAGGVYSGTGVANGTFNPATAGSGTHTIIYTYTDAKGCSDFASTTIKVDNCNLTLTKKATFNDENKDGHAQVGETISYRFGVRNGGNISLTDITITDPLVNVAGGPIASLNPGSEDNTTFTAIYTLVQGDINIAKVTNQATASGKAYGTYLLSDLSDDPDNSTNADPDNDGDPDDKTITSLDVYPLAVNDQVTINEDGQTTTIQVINNDSFGGNGPSNNPVRVVDAPDNGTISINNGGTPNNPSDDRIDYTANPDFNGTDSFTYEICDSDGDCSSATVNITITAINDAPDVVDDEYTTKEFHALEGNVLDNDSDVDNLRSELIVNTVPLTDTGHGTLVIQGDGKFVYTPQMDFVGLDYFEYEVCDNGTPEMCSVARVTIEVTPDDECQLLIPNGFSPDGDGIGDYFRIRCLYRFPDAQLQVYSRWGNLVFEKDHYGNGDYWTANDEWWDGRSNNKWAITNETLPSGTYVYILKLGNGDVMKGTVFIKGK